MDTENSNFPSNYDSAKPEMEKSPQATDSSPVSACGKEETMMDILKTMQLQIQLSDKLLLSLVNDNTDSSRKRKLSVSESDENEPFCLQSCLSGKKFRDDPATILVAPVGQTIPHTGPILRNFQYCTFINIFFIRNIFVAIF